MLPGEYTRSTPLVGVVMVSYHTGEALWVAIDSVLKQTAPVELILVDNGNADSVVEALQALARNDDRVTVLTGQGNVGFSKACNLGAAQAHAPYLLLLNPDCILPPRALRGMADAYRAFPNAALAGPKLVDTSGREQRGSRRALLTPRNALVEALFLHRLMPRRFGHLRLNRHETAQGNQPYEVPAVSGAFLFTEKSRYDALGGMDEKYFLHVEDLDFCWRVAQSGGKTLIVPEVEAVHIQGTSQAPHRVVEWHKAKGFVRYFYRHFRNSDYRYWLPFLVVATFLRFALRSLAGAIYRFLQGGVVLHPDTRRILLLHRYLRQAGEERPFAGRTVLVTGAFSQIGLCLMGRLVAGGAWVIALSRTRALPVHHSRLRYLQGDLKHLKLPDDLRADTVMHAAPLWLLPDALQSFSALGVKRVVAFGSTSAISKTQSADSGEREVSVRLQEAERMAMEKAQAFGIDLTILRPTLVYGTGLDANISRIATLIRRWRFALLYPPAAGLRQPVHADDLAMAAIQAWDNAATHGGIYDTSGGETLPYRAMVEQIFRTLGKRPRIITMRFLPAIFTVARLLFRKSLTAETARRMNRDLVFSHEKAMQDFGYRPRAFLSGGLADL